MKRVLLDTNILIHREARTVIREDIGSLFNWLDRLHIEKVIHPGSAAEIEKHADPDVVRTLHIKLGSYTTLKTLTRDTPAIAALRAGDQSSNDTLDTSLLVELAARRVDALITEDRGIHRKAALLDIASSVFTIDAFLEKVTFENPSLAEYKVLAVRRELLGEIDLGDAFFDSFREDYPDFDTWFRRKADETAYVCTDDAGAAGNRIVAFLYLKREDVGEDYSDIQPQFARAKRLKIGTFKVDSNGYKLGERFLKIVFDNALRYGVAEIYVTIFRHRPEQERLVQLLEEWGFSRHGTKISMAGSEDVLVRDFRPAADSTDPRHTFPYVAATARKFIVPIYPEYHTELFPDSILRTEKAGKYVDNHPHRNALSKVYISRSHERGLHTGDIIVFYRTASGGSAYYTSVATTLGVVQDVITGIPTLQDFIRLCRKRSVFTDEELAEHWNYYPRNRPFVVNFLYVTSFQKNINRKVLLESAIIPKEPFRGFLELADDAFNRLLEISGAHTSVVVR